MTEILVSVIIPCFNAEAYLRETIESVKRQHLQEIEVIVVDDGSSDRSVSLIRSEFPEIILVEIEHCGNPGRVRNRGTQLAKGKFIQYLDADDVLAPGKLKTQLQAMKVSEADIAYGNWHSLTQNTNNIYSPGEIIKREMSETPEIDLFTDFWCPPAVYLFRREIVEAVQGWNEKLLVIQDARFALDCALRGARFIYCPEVMAYYRIHTGESVSTCDPKAFVRDCFINAVEIEAWWRSNGGVEENRLKALLKVYGYVARASFEKDHPLFEEARLALERLQPGYIPASPKFLAIASKFLGYRQAEWLALKYRRTKATLRRLKQNEPS